MLDWMIAHNMGILLMAAPLITVSWAGVIITEKIKKIIKK